jgi:hypothetical protein
MMKKASTAMFVVWALSKPGPKWRPISLPAQRSQLVLVVRDQWKQGNLARLRPAAIAKAA